MLEPLHRDNWWHPVPAQKGEAYVRAVTGSATRMTVAKGHNHAPCGCNVIWLLTDFSEENGGTRLVPGSHLLPDGPDSSVPYKVPTIAATGKAGSIVFFDRRLWHGTGQNLTDEPRIGLLTFYVGPQFRQNENFFLGLDSAVIEQSPDRLLDLLGYTTRFYFGQTDALSSRKRLRAREPWILEIRIKET